MRWTRKWCRKETEVNENVGKKMMARKEVVAGKGKEVGEKRKEVVGRWMIRRWLGGG